MIEDLLDYCHATVQEDGYKKVQPVEPVKECRDLEKENKFRNEMEYEVVKRIMQKRIEYNKEFVTKM